MNISSNISTINSNIVNAKQLFYDKIKIKHPESTILPTSNLSDIANAILNIPTGGLTQIVLDLVITGSVVKCGTITDSTDSVGVI